MRKNNCLLSNAKCGKLNLVKIISMSFFVLAMLILAKSSYADSLTNLDKSLGTVSSSISGLITGNLGKIVAFLALLWTIIGCVFKFNVMLLFSLLGVLVLLAFGVSIVEGTFA